MRSSVPAEPVKKTFFPSSTTILNILICSLLSTTSKTFSSTPPATPSSPEPTCTVTLGVKKLSIVSLGCFAPRESPGALVDLRFEGCFVVDLFISWKRSKTLGVASVERDSRVRSCDRKSFVIQQTTSINIVESSTCQHPARSASPIPTPAQSVPANTMPRRRPDKIN